MTKNILFRALLLCVVLGLASGFDRPHSAAFYPPTEPCECLQAGKIIRCNRNHDKCIIERKKITYFIEIKNTNSPKRMLLEVTKSSGGMSNVVYNGRAYIIEKRAENLVVIKIPLSFNKGYQWDDLTREDFLVVTYNTKTQDFSMEAEGKMANFVDKAHGLALPSIKSEMAALCKDKPGNMKAVLKAAAAYFVLEYPKALKS